MNLIYYKNEPALIAGLTLKDKREPESWNMALHTALSQQAVLSNRSKLAKILDVNLDSFVCSNQNHGNRYYQVTSRDKGKGALDLTTAIPNTDALYTFEPNLLLCCFTADCVPLVFFNKVRNLVGVIHSGWQGSIKEITLKVFKHLIVNEKCKPEDFKVYIGPSISQEKFEVDEDVFLKFKTLNYTLPNIYYKKETNKYHINNKEIVKKQCQLAGVPSENIHIEPKCTYKDSRFFSHRRDKDTGRHMSFVIRKT